MRNFDLDAHTHTHEKKVFLVKKFDAMIGSKCPVKMVIKLSLAIQHSHPLQNKTEKVLCIGFKQHLSKKILVDLLSICSFIQRGRWCEDVHLPLWRHSFIVYAICNACCVRENGLSRHIFFLLLPLLLLFHGLQ